MTASAGAWYRVGEVNVTKDSQSVVGVGTNWQNDVISIAIGDAFTVDATTWYEVIAVNSDTSITLDRGFEGSTQNSAKYAIMRGTSGTILTRIAGQVAVQFNQKQLFLDELRTWLNSDNASEELTDSHGLKQSLKTPSQMARDHAEKLAQLNEIHPFPWAMRKVEFEARRQQNLEEYAASGFVHFGKHFNSGFVNEGLTTLTDVWSEPKINRFWLGRNPSSTNTQGKSTSHSAIISIAGVLTDLESIGDDYNAASRLTTVKLPPVEDGSRTYDSETGVSVSHATSALAFAAETETNKVVTDRVDVWGFESFLREINDSDPFVYANGLIQSRSNSIDGVATSDDNVRPITYFAWYDGDMESRGRGVNWQAATEAQRMAIASNPRNNIYFDDRTGKFYQWCVRGRSFAGMGNGDWLQIDYNQSTLRYSIGNEIPPQGALNYQATTTKEESVNYAEMYVGTFPDYNGDKETISKGAFTLRNASINNNKGINRECYFLVCGTVTRLNEGAYHPSFNPFGTRRWRYRTDNLNITGSWSYMPGNYNFTKESCFDLVGPSGSQIGAADYGGNIQQGASGRPDFRLYDVIYASGQGGICRDMRYSAQGLGIEDIAQHDLKAKSGDLRGSENAVMTKIYQGSVDGKNSGWGIYHHDNLPSWKELWVVSDVHNVSDYVKTGDRFTALHSSGEIVECKVKAVYSRRVVGEYVGTVNFRQYSSGDHSNSYILFHNKTNISISGEYSHVELIGNPAKIILSDDFKDGWIGGWSPKLVPDNEPETISLTKPASSLMSGVFSPDGGETWSSWGTSLDTIKNTVNAGGGATSSQNIYMLNYKTKAKLTKPITLTNIFGPVNGFSSVFASSRYTDDTGRLLGFSLTGQINKSESGGPLYSDHALKSYTLFRGEFYSLRQNPTHEALVLPAPINDSPAFKALNFITEINGQAFICYAYAELHYDSSAGSWGDDSQVHIVDGQSTITDLNGHTVKVGTAIIVEPLGWVKDAA